VGEREETDPVIKVFYWRFKMKKVTLLLVLLVLCLYTPVFADHDDCDSSGLLSTDSVVRTGTGRLCGMTIHPDGLTVCTITLYDNASAATGTILMKHTGDIGLKDSKGQHPPYKTTVRNGIYGKVTSGTCGFIVYSKKD
jgi:hypothetical protein